MSDAESGTSPGHTGSGTSTEHTGTGSTNSTNTTNNSTIRLQLTVWQQTL